jgi:hypothetical protein
MTVYCQGRGRCLSSSVLFPLSCRVSIERPPPFFLVTACALKRLVYLRFAAGCTCGCNNRATLFMLFQHTLQNGWTVSVRPGLHTWAVWMDCLRPSRVTRVGRVDGLSPSVPGYTRGPCGWAGNRALLATLPLPTDGFQGHLAIGNQGHLLISNQRHLVWMWRQTMCQARVFCRTVANDRARSVTCLDLARFPVLSRAFPCFLR